MVSDAEFETKSQRRDRLRQTRKVRLIRWAAFGLFLLCSGLVVVGVLELARWLREDPAPAKADVSLLSAVEGPPRALAYVDTDAVNDALGQIDVDPNGRTTAPGEVRARHLLKLIELLGERRQLEDLDGFSGRWKALHVGTVVRTPVRWPQVRGHDEVIVLVGPVRVRLLAGPMTWRPDPGSPMSFIGQVTRTRGRLDIRPWAVYTSR